MIGIPNRHTWIGRNVYIIHPMMHMLVILCISIMQIQSAGEVSWLGMVNVNRIFW